MKKISAIILSFAACAALVCCTGQSEGQTNAVTEQDTTVSTQAQEEIAVSGKQLAAQASQTKESLQSYKYESSTEMTFLGSTSCVTSVHKVLRTDDGLYYSCSSENGTFSAYGSFYYIDGVMYTKLFNSVQKLEMPQDDFLKHAEKASVSILGDFSQMFEQYTVDENESGITVHLSGINADALLEQLGASDPAFKMENASITKCDISIQTDKNGMPLKESVSVEFTVSITGVPVTLGIEHTGEYSEFNSITRADFPSVDELLKADETAEESAAFTKSPEI